MTNEQIVDYVMNSPHNTNKTILTQMLNQNGQNGFVQSDWNQNDPTKADYVKNRTHWAHEGEMYFVPEMTITVSEELYSETLVESGVALVEGETYTVTFDGVAYNCVARYDPDWQCIALGDGEYLEASASGNNEPFFVDSYDDGSIYMSAKTAGEHTVSIRGIGVTIQKLDPMYLPDGVFGFGEYHEFLAPSMDISKAANACFPGVDTNIYNVTGPKTYTVPPEMWEKFFWFCMTVNESKMPTFWWGEKIAMYPGFDDTKKWVEFRSNGYTFDETNVRFNIYTYTMSYDGEKLTVSHDYSVVDVPHN